MIFGAYRNGVVKTNKEVPGGWSGTLPLSDYGMIARHPTTIAD